MAIILKGGKLIDGTGNEPLSDAMIRIEGGVVAEIGRSISYGTEDTVIDVTGKAILPGLVNSHEHLSHKRTYRPGEKRVEEQTTYMLLIRSVRDALASLKAGVTTVRDVCAPDYIDIALRDAIKAGVVLGPRMFVSGKGVMITGALDWRIGREADGADEVRKATREQLKAGADLIKVFAGRGGAIAEKPTSPEFTIEEMGAAVEEAHKAHKKIAVHAGGRLAIDMAIELGVDSIEHGTYLSREAAQKMAARGIFLVPTLSTGEWWTDHALEFGEPADLVELMQRNRRSRLQSVRNAVEAKVKIGVGTDTAGEMVREMELLMEFGLTAMDVIVASTRLGAELIGVGDVLGTIEPGKYADVIVVDGDPLSNIATLRNVDLVIKEGVVLEPKQFATVLGEMSS